MSAIIKRSVTWTPINNPTSNPNFEWINVDGVTWVSRADAQEANTSDFTIQNNDTNAVRTSQWEVRHWNYVNDNTLVDSFTITQDAEGAVTTTTTEPPTYTITYQAVANPSDIVGTHPSTVSGVSAGNYTVSGPTWTVTGMTFIGYAEGDSAQSPVNIQPGDVITITGDKTLYAKYVATTTTSTSTSTTTNPPVTYTLTLGSGTSGGQAIQFEEANPTGQSIAYTQSPNSGTPAVRVSSLPAWLTEVNITSNAIQLDLNSNTTTYPAASESATITYRHGDAPVGQGGDILYVQFVAAPANSILVTSTNVTPDSVASNGEGASTYTDNNALGSNTQAVTYTLSLDPDVTLTSSEVYWSDTLPSTSGHLGQPSPYWATPLTINNTPSSGQAQISYSHIDPNAPRSVSTSVTDEQAGTQATPGTILLTNQRYVIVRHPDDTSHWVAILVTAPNDSITTTQAPVTRTFTWAPNPLAAGDVSSLGISFSYDGTEVELLDGEFSIQNGTFVSTSMSAGHPGNLEFNSSTDNGTAYFKFLTDSENPIAEDVEIRWNKPSYVTLTSVSSGTASSYASETVSWTPTCIVEDEPILMADGTTKLIQDIVLGDELASLNIATLSNEEDAYLTWSTGIESFSGTGTTATVTRFIPGQYARYMNFNSGGLKITHEHPVLIDRAGTVQFISAENVQVGDRFYQDQTGWVEITSAEVVNETVNTYTIGCEDADVYYANGVLVHNAEKDIVKSR